ncbi:MAG: IS30 family transposase [Acidimicrobiales bacterium]|nr:IS30 family transposase [Acidimicrobiales bacterium]
MRPEMWEVPDGRLTLDHRVEIRLGLERGESFAVIAERIGFHRSTVWREVKDNGGRDLYAPMAAHRAACSRRERPKETKLAANPRMCAMVVEGMEKLWSPEQISAALHEDHPDDPEMWVSHETIYKSLYVQGRGELRRELTACLRTGRAARKHRSRVERRGQLKDIVTISERPAEVEDRAVPGHWEGDLIIGKNNKSAIGTLVERSIRFVMLLHLPEGQSAPSVRDAMTEAIQTLPEALRRSITWDRGKEMAEHAQFSVDTGVDVYFCDPHSPWQRGSNENTNGLLRQYFPKGTDLSLHDVERLAEVADSLNGRPRKTLGWKNPAQALDELLVAMTD